ncbi:MAG: hypothetical protein JO076_00425, partial [Verrucomicrobia bacterium]|nr:hypothetical protein [Verrucomicrobiota bacterium]
MTALNVDIAAELFGTVEGVQLEGLPQFPLPPFQVWPFASSETITKASTQVIAIWYEQGILNRVLFMLSSLGHIFLSLTWKDWPLQAFFPEVKGGKGKANDLFASLDGWLFAQDAPKETVEFMRVLLGKDIQIKLA